MGLPPVSPPTHPLVCPLTVESGWRQCPQSVCQMGRVWLCQVGQGTEPQARLVQGDCVRKASLLLTTAQHWLAGGQCGCLEEGARP